MQRGSANISKPPHTNKAGANESAALEIGNSKDLIHQLLGHLKSATDFELDARLGTDAACGRLCCVADALDLGLRNHRFQNIACHFKSRRFDQWKISFWRQFCDLGMTSRTIVILAQILAHAARSEPQPMQRRAVRR
jgi:hypothetical protein